MALGAWIFVLAVYSVLGVSFLATTGTLIWEFKGSWLDLAALDSHLFIFFPTLGMVALLAFLVPSVLLVDLYWRHIPHSGKARFILGFVLAILASYWGAGKLADSVRRSYWETAPRVLNADRGEPAGCMENGVPCERLPILAAVHNLRQVAQTRFGLGGLTRDCGESGSDALAEKAPVPEGRRYCLASTPYSTAPALQNDAQCCKAQSRLIAVTEENYVNASTRSTTAEVNALLLPFKVFFLLVVFIISILLAIHHRKVERHYHGYLPLMEIGLFAGALCILFFPVMSQSLLQSSEILSGSAGRGTYSKIVPLISLLSMAWALLIGVFFYRRGPNERLVTIGRFAGMLASNIGIIKYNLVVSIFVWALGAGASATAFVTLAGLCVTATAALAAAMFHFWPAKH